MENYFLFIGDLNLKSLMKKVDGIWNTKTKEIGWYIPLEKKLIFEELIKKYEEKKNIRTKKETE